MIWRLLCILDTAWKRTGVLSVGGEKDCQDGR